MFDEKTFQHRTPQLPQDPEAYICSENSYVETADYNDAKLNLSCACRKNGTRYHNNVGYIFTHLYLFFHDVDF